MKMDVEKACAQLLPPSPFDDANLIVTWKEGAYSSTCNASSLLRGQEASYLELLFVLTDM